MWKILFSLFQKISMTSVMWFFIILQHKITYKSNNNLPIFAYIWPNFTQYFPSKFFQNFCPLPSRTPMLKMLLGTVSASCLNSPTWNRNAMGTALLQRSLNFTFADHRVVFSFFQNTVLVETLVRQGPWPTCCDPQPSHSSRHTTAPGRQLPAVLA